MTQKGILVPLCSVSSSSHGRPSCLRDALTWAIWQQSPRDDLPAPNGLSAVCSLREEGADLGLGRREFSLGSLERYLLYLACQEVFAKVCQPLWFNQLTQGLFIFKTLWDWLARASSHQPEGNGRSGGGEQGLSAHCYETATQGLGVHCSETWTQGLHAYHHETWTQGLRAHSCPTLTLEHQCWAKPSSCCPCDLSWKRVGADRNGTCQWDRHRVYSLLVFTENEKFLSVPNTSSNDLSIKSYFLAYGICIVKDWVKERKCFEDLNQDFPPNTCFRPCCVRAKKDALLTSKLRFQCQRSPGMEEKDSPAIEPLARVDKKSPISWEQQGFWWVAQCQWKINTFKPGSKAIEVHRVFSFHSRGLDQVLWEHILSETRVAIWTWAQTVS